MDDPDGAIFAAVFINGIDLRALVIATEETELAERYWTEEFVRADHHSLEAWLAPENWIAFLAPKDVAPPSRHWLGAPDPDLTERGRAAVLTCTCGCFGCGGAAARITVDDRTVPLLPIPLSS